MNKYEVIVKTEEVKKLTEIRQFEGALKLLQTLDTDMVNKFEDLMIFVEVYLQNSKYEEARDIMLRLYEKTATRKLLSKLIFVSVKLNDIDGAEKYYQEYLKIAPRDINKFIFRYKIDKANNKDIDTLIKSLEALKEYDYIEEWAYELAKNYHKAGYIAKCIKECSDIILWFGHGVVVEKAKMLRAYHINNAAPKEPEKKDEDMDFSATCELNEILKKVRTRLNESGSLTFEPVNQSEYENDFTTNITAVEEEYAQDYDEIDLEKANKKKLQDMFNIRFDGENTNNNQVNDQAKTSENYEENKSYVRVNVKRNIPEESYNNENQMQSISEELYNAENQMQMENVPEKLYNDKNQMQSVPEELYNAENQMQMENVPEKLYNDKNQMQSVPEELYNAENQMQMENVSKEQYNTYENEQIQIPLGEPKRILEDNSKVMDKVDLMSELENKRRANISIAKVNEEIINQMRKEAEETNSTKKDDMQMMEQETKVSPEEDTSSYEEALEHELENVQTLSYEDALKEELKKLQDDEEIVTPEDNQSIQMDIVESGENYIDDAYDSQYDDPTSNIYENIYENEYDSYDYIELNPDIFCNFYDIDYLNYSIRKVIYNIHVNMGISNLIITGPPCSGKTTLARMISKQLFDMGYVSTNKIARITGDIFNRVDLSSKASKLIDGCIIIQKAEQITTEAFDRLIKLITTYEGRMIIFLETTHNVQELFKINERLQMHFISLIEMPYYNVDELIGFAHSYASSIEYYISDSAEYMLKRGLTNTMRNMGGVCDLGIVIRTIDEAVESVKRRNRYNALDIMNRGYRDNRGSKVIEKQDIML